MKSTNYFLSFRLVPNPCASNPSPCIHGVCYDAYTNAEQVDLSVDGLSCQCYEGYFDTYCGGKQFVFTM